jgi:hypothetical protein
MKNSLGKIFKRSTLALLLSLGVQQMASAAPNCSLTFPAPPNDVLTGYLTIYPNYDYNPADPLVATFMVDITTAGQLIPPGLYPGWCMDEQTLTEAPAITVPGALESGNLYSSCDPNLNSELPPGHPNTLVSPAAWQAVNWLLNHATNGVPGSPGTNVFYWDEQTAINHFVGSDLGDTNSPWSPTSPDPNDAPNGNGYPPFDPVDVQQLINNALTYSPSWVPGCGDVIAAIWVTPANAPFAQFVLLPVPVPVNIYAPPGTNLLCNSTSPITSPVTSIADSAVSNLVVVTPTGTPYTVTHVDTTSGCSVTRTFTITAQCGSGTPQTQTVTYMFTTDTTAPTITGVPPNTNFNCYSDYINYTNTVHSTVSAFDNCTQNLTPVLCIVTESAPGSSCNDVIKRVWCATDACGNMATNMQVITISNKVPPVITGFPANLNLTCAQVVPGASNNLVTGIGNCGGPVTVTHDADVTVPGACGNAYTIKRVYHIFDTCGLSTSQTQTIAVVDVPPTVVCPPNVTINLSNSCQMYCTFTPKDWCSSLCGNSGTYGWWGCFNQTNSSGNCWSAWTNWWNSSCGANVDNSWWSSGNGNCLATNWTGCWNTWYYSWMAGWNWCDNNWSWGNNNWNWWAPGTGCNPGNILSNCFSSVYPTNCVQIGLPTNGYCIKFTSCNAVRNCLSFTSGCSALNGNAVNPTTCNAGAFCSHVLALQLNCDFGDHYQTTGFGGRCGDLVYCDSSSPCNGKKVRDICAIANCALGGGSLPAGCTISNLCTLVSNLNQCFEGCTLNGWCTNHLVAITNPPPSQTGTATVVGGCSASTLGYADSVSTDSCGAYIITRTWTVVDACGSSNSCQQTITEVPASVNPPTIVGLPTCGYLGCNPTNLPTDASIAALVSGITACGSASISVTHVDTTNGCTVTRTFTITATGAYGTTSSAPLVYTWTIDKSGPSITCPPSITINVTNNCTMYCTFTPKDWCTPDNTWYGQQNWWNDWCQTNNTSGCWSSWTNWWTGCAGGKTQGKNWWNSCNRSTDNTGWCGGWTGNYNYWGCWWSDWNAGNQTGNWWVPCNGQNPCTILTNCFNSVYTNGCVQIGLPGGNCATFTSPWAACQALKNTGNCGTLNGCYTNNSNCGGGSFCAHVLALQLNCDLGDYYRGSSSFGGPCGDLIYCDNTSPCNGKSVRQICNIANCALGGGSLPNGCTLTSLCTLVSNLNSCFEGCQPSSFCSSHLKGTCLPQCSQTGTPTIGSSCLSAPCLSYTDSCTNTVAGTYVDTRTWVAVDGCGLSNTCTQVITIIQH